MNLPFLTFLTWLALSGTLSSFANSIPLTLEAALDEALLNNRIYQISDLEARTAKGMVSWGRAEALPKVDVIASQTHGILDSRQERRGAAIEEKIGAKSVNSALGIVGSWTVFDGLTSWAAHDKLESQAMVLAERQAQVRQDIAAQLIMAYVDVVRQQTVLAAMDTAVSLSRERVKITEGKYSFGSLSKLDLLQAKLDLNEDLSANLKQSALLENARYTLKRILARSDTANITVADSIPLISATIANSFTETTMDINPEIRQAALGRNLASAAYREYRGHLFPQVGVSVGYNYGLTESEAGLFKSNETLGWNYGVNLKWNIFDGFVLPGDYRTAKAVQRRADLLYADARSRWETSLVQAKANHGASLQVVALEDANRELARENVTIAMERLRLGTIASLELRAAQEKFVAAETRFVTARFECKRAETELLRLAGLLGPKNH